jgi:hypothetical protein
VSKESKAKKRAQQLAKQNPAPVQSAAPKKQKSAPAFVSRPVRRINKRFVILLAIWFFALVVALYFVTRPR